MTDKTPEKEGGESRRGLLFPLLVEVDPSEGIHRRQPGVSSPTRTLLEGSLLVRFLRRADKGLRKTLEGSRARGWVRRLAGVAESPRGLAVLFLSTAGASALLWLFLPAPPGPPSLLVGVWVRVFLLLAALVGAAWLSGIRRE
ncbi:MAG: hypothetical protein ACE5JS_04070 [Nitrospinota bacterium]